MNDQLKIKMPYEYFKIKTSGFKKNKPEEHRALQAAYYYLLKNLDKKQGVPVLAGKRAYYSTQKCTVKVSYAFNDYKSRWDAHGRYLARSGAQREKEKGLGFNETEEDILIAKMLKRWQTEEDPRIWKLIISPEKAADIDLKEHIRQLMERVEKDLGTKLQWVAIEHYNTLHFHVHLVIRGIRDEGQELRIDDPYIKTGFKDRSQQILTEKLGLRTWQDLLESRKKVIKARHITELDRLIGRVINDELKSDHFYNLDWCTKNDELYQKNVQIKQRLEYLETLGLAKKFTDSSWQVKPKFLDHLRFMQEQDDIIKSQRRHSGQIIDKDLPTIINKLPNLGDTIIGRVIGTGLSERNEDLRYILIEGIDGQIHYVKANSKIICMRDNHQIFAGNIIYMERSKFTQEGKEISYIKVDTYRDFDSLRTTVNVTNIDKYIVNRIINNGYIPDIAPTANAVRVEFMKIVQGRVNYLKRCSILNERLEVERDRLEREMGSERNSKLRLG